MFFFFFLYHVDITIVVHIKNTALINLQVTLISAFVFPRPPDWVNVSFACVISLICGSHLILVCSTFMYQLADAPQHAGSWKGAQFYTGSYGEPPLKSQFWKSVLCMLESTKKIIPAPKFTAPILAWTTERVNF